jgi:hypothetical protein
VESSNQCDNKKSKQGKDCSMTDQRASHLLQLWDEHIATGELSHRDCIFWALPVSEGFEPNFTCL